MRVPETRNCLLTRRCEQYGEKRITVDETTKDAEGASVSTKIEYRIWVCILLFSQTLARHARVFSRYCRVLLSSYTARLIDTGQNPFRSKLAAAVIGGIDNIFIAPGKKVLYLGAASGTSVSHGKLCYEVATQQSRIKSRC